MSAEATQMTAREHALEAGRLAAAIPRAEERFREEMLDPMRRTEAVATGAIKAHHEALDWVLRRAEVHARIADVLMRSESLDGGS